MNNTTQLINLMSDGVERSAAQIRDELGFPIEIASYMNNQLLSGKVMKIKRKGQPMRYWMKTEETIDRLLRSPAPMGCE